MTRLAVPILLWAFLSGALPAWAQEGAKPELLTPKAISELALDDLFGKLAEHANSRAGKAIEAEILKRFNASGSDTADLLMAWAAQAIEEKKYPQALDILDQIVILRPNFAEAWNRRATVHYLGDDYASSLADIRNALALEPRHFGALSGLGLILEETGRKDQAAEVFRKALDINPQLETVKKSLERLEKEIDGDSI
jgi:tetratricopeptide (TPR) repeat protein